ncbi:MAG: hypothetical protein EBR10_07325 [Planctomycetes bacterium]|nr:hypothetical protein [Planctomycetota bacterium]
MSTLNRSMTLVSVSTFLAAGNFAAAGVGVVEATGAFLVGGSSSPSYVSAVGAPYNPVLDQFIFNDVQPFVPLILGNWYFENYAYNGGNIPAGALSNDNWLDGSNTASLAVTVMSGGNVISSNSYELFQTGVSGNNRFWQLSAPAQNTNLSAGLSNGSYSISFRTTFTFNVWSGFVSTGSSTTATSVATFSVVPAPGAIALIGAAGLLGSRRRR